MNPDFIVSPIVGGIIGAFANWLAITMLFFPLNEKKIFGKTIPFTPGIVPKERRRIAKSVADTVANYFLSEDVIVNAVVSPQAEKQFKDYIGDIIKAQRENNQTIGEFIFNLTGKDFEEVSSNFEEKAVLYLSQQLKSPAVAEGFANYLTGAADNFIDKSIKDIVSIEDFEKYKETLGDKLFNLLNSDLFKGFLDDTVSKQINKLSKSKKKLKDVLPASLINAVKAKAVTNSDKVADMIIDYVTSSSVQFKLRKFLKNSFDSSFKLRMIAKVVDIDKIFESIIDELVVFLEHPENHKEIGEYIIKVVDSFSEKRVKDILEEYDIEIKNEEIRENIEKVIGAVVTKEDLIKILSEIVSYDSEVSIRGFLDSIDSKILENREQFIRNTVDSIFEKITFESLVRDIYKKKAAEISNEKVSRFAGMLKDSDILFVQDAATANFKRLISGESDRILRIIDICKIVEDRINAFDIEEMEKIMLGIIKKDIVKMRWFEAGIGFLIGLLVPVLNWVIGKL